jgi:acyl-CoA synthetase (AMP-forming)/AMP-acid ligase II
MQQRPADTSAPLLETTVGGVLRAAADADADAIAMVAGMSDPADRRSWTYGQLLDEAERAARALYGRFEPEERVAVWAPGVPEWVVLELAAGLAGLTLVTVNPAYRPNERPLSCINGRGPWEHIRSTVDSVCKFGARIFPAQRRHVCGHQRLTACNLTIKSLQLCH